jgi:class 3 adenylate cyclase
MEVSSYSKNVFLKSGKAIDIRIGIHTGQVISGVIGDTKPQFSLLGETLNKANNICKLTMPG